MKILTDVESPFFLDVLIDSNLPEYAFYVLGEHNWDTKENIIIFEVVYRYRYSISETTSVYSFYTIRLKNEI